MTTAIDISRKAIALRQEAAPIKATRIQTGVALVPRVRPLGRGGLADLLALHRHTRRMRDRGLDVA